MTARQSALYIGSVFFLALGCGDEEDAQQPGGMRGGWGGREAAAIPVKGEKVTRGDMSAYIETYSRLEAERRVSVLARTTGLLEELAAEEGDLVRQGQVMIRLNKDELNLNLRQAEQAFADASTNYDRIKTLYERNMVSQSEYDTAHLRLDNAKIVLEETQLNLAYADVTAPIAGVVTQRLVEVGDLVRGNQEVFVIADRDPLLVRIFAPEQRMYQLHPGQEATIAVEALPDTSFRGRIRMISPEVDPASGTVKVTLEVASDGILKPGMFATVRIITERRPQTLIIPKKALILETDEDDVFLIEDSKVRRVAVELGFVEDDQIEIVSGLQEGDQVVTIGHEGLKDGAAVRLAGEGLPTAEELAASESAEPRGGGFGPPGARGGGPGGGLPDSLRQIIAEYRRQGKPLPDSLRQVLRAMREQGGGGWQGRGRGEGRGRGQ